MENNSTFYHGLALFSGGLDSILAIKILEEQGLRIKCLHFVTPFFGKPEKITYWSKIYNLDIEAIDISEIYVRMLQAGPTHGFGSALNPCVDCKIAMLRVAVDLLPKYGASFIVSGEVLGQRPMSQRRDSLNIIIRDSGAKGLLIRPLSAKYLDETQAEIQGIIKRELLYDITGRGRSRQMELARHFQLSEIPTPAGGCVLTEQLAARNFWPLLQYKQNIRVADFELASTGRQFWNFSADKAWWLCVGRNKDENARLLTQAEPGDTSFKLKNFPGPIALLRKANTETSLVEKDAAAFMASFSAKAATEAAEQDLEIIVTHHTSEGFSEQVICVRPLKATSCTWNHFDWNKVTKVGLKPKHTGKHSE